jgi:hypothetical protein
MTTKKKAGAKPPAKKKAAPKKAAAKGNVTIKAKPAAEPIRIVVEVVVRIENSAAGNQNILPGFMKTTALAEIGSFTTKSAADIEKDVKQMIIVHSPKTDITVDDLKDDHELEANLDYQDDDFDTLQMDLDGYVKEQKPGEEVTSSDVSDNETVGKIVNMIKEKLK